MLILKQKYNEKMNRYTFIQASYAIRKDMRSCAARSSCRRHEASFSINFLTSQSDAEFLLDLFEFGTLFVAV